MVLRWNDLEEASDTSALNSLGGDANARDAGKTGSQMLVENVLANRDEYGAEESLTEKHEGSADGHFFAGEHRLRSHVGRLEATAQAEAVHDLVADPLAGGCVDFEDGEKARTD